MQGDTQGDTPMQGDTGGYGGASSEPALPRVEVGSLLEYAAIRFADGEHLAALVLKEMEAGKLADDLKTYYAKNHSFLMAYFADCVSRMQDAM